MTARTALMLLSPRRLRRTVQNLLLRRKLRGIPGALETWNAYFNPAEYTWHYPEVARAGVDPELHFLVFGNEELRDPSERFDTRFYLGRYPDVGGMNALLHYVLHGRAARRTPHPYAEDADVAVVETVNERHADAPLASVVIPCFNYGRYLETAIRSVLDQTFRDFELIVVEGGSTDPETVAEVRRLESLALPKTSFYYRAGPCLAGDNRNFGIERARGRYICCLDADDRLRPIYLEAAVFIAEAYGFDFVYPSVETFGEEQTRWLVRNTSFPAILEENEVSTAALFRRSAWAAIGGFRDWGAGDRYVFEDWDFWIRMLGHGFTGRAIREPLLLYRVHGGSLSSAARAPEAHGAQLREANRDLIHNFRPESVRRYSVRDPYVNLGPLEDGKTAVLFALPFLTIGGAEQLFRTIGQGLAERGERLIVTTSLTLSPAVPEYRACFDGITSHVYPLPGLFPNNRARRAFFHHLIRRYRVRAILLAGSEFVYHLLPGLREEFPHLTIVDQLFNDAVHVANNRRYAAHIHATVVPSAELERTLVDRHGADPATLHVIPHGIRIPPEAEPDPNVYPPESRGKVIVGFFGRLSSEKAPDAFVEIARKLAAESDLFFVMTGDGPERKRVLELIRKHRLAGRIYAPGFVEDALPLMRAADIVVLPSRIDGMPLAVLEAQALAKPVVASRVGSLPAMIEDGETGFLCPIGNTDAFCRRILELARGRALRERMGRAGRRRAIERYGAERMIAHYDEVLRNGMMDTSV